MSLNTLENNFSIKEQREKLLQLNPDLVFGVYDLVEDGNDKIKLNFLENVLCCYPNQFNNLKGLKDFKDITILNLGSLRKGNIETLHGKNKQISNPVLLSNGVIETLESTNKFGKTSQYMIPTLRDGGAADKLQRTTTAGRNSGDDLNEDLETEHIEEAPFLGYDKDGNLALATIDDSKKSKEILKESIELFLKRKYLKPQDPNYEFVKKNFERNFKPIKYNNLGNILQEIIKNDNIFTYSVKKENLEGLEGDMKELSLGKSKGKYFVYFDKENNTIEYRQVRIRDSIKF